MATLAPVERPLTRGERAILEQRRSTLEMSARAAMRRMGWISAAICGVLAVLTLLASDAPDWVVLVFWLTLGGVLTLWTGLPERRLLRAQQGSLADALKADYAREYRIQSGRVVEFEEIEDEGACYAFGLDAGHTVVIVGQQYYESMSFPNDDFSIVEVLSTRGTPVDELLITRGRRLQVERIVAADVKGVLELPEHLTVLSVPLDDAERAMGGPGEARPGHRHK
jgi:hypothetical protein